MTDKPREKSKNHALVADVAKLSNKDLYDIIPEYNHRLSERQYEALAQTCGRLELYHRIISELREQLALNDKESIAITLAKLIKAHTEFGHGYDDTLEILDDDKPH